MDVSKITKHISEHGFAHVSDMSKWIDFTEPQQQIFCQWWENLARDENFRNYTHRERRILRYRSADKDAAMLEINPDANFHPKVTYDIEYKKGTNTLSYAEDGFISDQILQQIIHLDQSIVYAMSGQTVPVCLDVHQFRVKASAGKVSPTTSGIHKDGFDWIFMHFINRHNIRPVISEVFNTPDEQGVIFKKEMNVFLETLVVNDDKCWHRASSVAPLDDQSFGWRDLLLVTCRCFPKGNSE